MFVIRPIAQKDLEKLLELLKASGHGLTTLPKDRTILKRRITLSERSFAERDTDKPRGEDYLFVMEEIFTGNIVGVCAIISKIGGFEPYYFYRVETELKESKSADITNEVTTLHPHLVHNGPAEICSLYLHPKYRNAQNGRFLSLSRFLFMAENRHLFETEVIAEMRGVVNKDGVSPFWDAIGSHIFKIDFPQADYLYVKSRRFIEDLMPKHPIIANLLPEEAQEVIAQVHQKTEPAKRILEKEGFSFSGLVGIFEGGIVLNSEVANIRTVKESVVGEIAEISERPFKSTTYIIALTGAHFRSTLGSVTRLRNGGLKIDGVTAAALKIRLGDTIRYSTFNPNIKLKPVKKPKKRTKKKAKGKR